MAKVSILMNAYNAQKYLKEAIDSIYAQTFKDWEIIFIDNCSTDNTKEIARSYDEKLKYYSTDKNISLGAARNFGLQFVTGEYLAFLDTDDIWMPEKLEKQLDIINDDIAFVYSPVIQINSSGNILRDTKINKKYNFDTMLERYDINMQSVLLNLKLVKFKFNENLFYCPDYELFMNIAAQQLKYTAIDIPLVKYRVHENSLSSKTVNIQMKEILLVLQNIQEAYPFLKNKNNFDIAINKFKHLIDAKNYLGKNRYFKAAKELLALSKYDKKYFAVSLSLYIPIFNAIIYKGFLKKYV